MLVMLKQNDFPLLLKQKGLMIILKKIGLGLKSPQKWIMFLKK